MSELECPPLLKIWRGVNSTSPVVSSAPDQVLARPLGGCACLRVCLPLALVVAAHVSRRQLQHDKPLQSESVAATCLEQESCHWLPAYLNVAGGVMDKLRHIQKDNSITGHRRITTILPLKSLLRELSNAPLIAKN